MQLESLVNVKKKVIVDPSPYRLLVRVPDEGTIPIRTSNLKRHKTPHVSLRQRIFPFRACG